MADFDEAQHPRDAHGEFTSGGGSGALGKWAASKAKPSESAAKAIGAAKAMPSLFSSKEVAALPLKVVQKEHDGDKLFAQAREAHEMQLDLLNRGKGLSKDLGARTVRGDKEPLPEFIKDVEKATEESGPVVVIGPMKSKERSEEKVKADGGGDWATLTDVVRATVAVDTMAQVGNVVQHLQARGMKLARQPTDRFSNPTDAGYRDLMLKVEYPNGHIGEIQVQIKGMLKAKEQAHPLYEKVRTIEGKLKTENRSMTDEERKTFDSANAQMREIYGAAWRKANGRPDKRSDFDVAKDNWL